MLNPLLSPSSTLPVPNAASTANLSANGQAGKLGNLGENGFAALMRQQADQRLSAFRQSDQLALAARVSAAARSQTQARSALAASHSTAPATTSTTTSATATTSHTGLASDGGRRSATILSPPPGAAAPAHTPAAPPAGTLARSPSNNAGAPTDGDPPLDNAPAHVGEGSASPQAQTDSAPPNETGEDLDGRLAGSLIGNDGEPRFRAAANALATSAAGAATAATAAAHRAGSARAAAGGGVQDGLALSATAAAAAAAAARLKTSAAASPADDASPADEAAARLNLDAGLAWLATGDANATVSMAASQAAAAAALASAAAAPIDSAASTQVAASSSDADASTLAWDQVQAQAGALTGAGIQSGHGRRGPGQADSNGPAGSARPDDSLHFGRDVVQTTGSSAAAATDRATNRRQAGNAAGSADEAATLAGLRQGGLAAASAGTLIDPAAAAAIAADAGLSRADKEPAETSDTTDGVAGLRGKLGKHGLTSDDASASGTVPAALRTPQSTASPSEPERLAQPTGTPELTDPDRAARLTATANAAAAATAAIAAATGATAANAADTPPGLSLNPAPDARSPGDLTRQAQAGQATPDPTDNAVASAATGRHPAALAAALDAAASRGASPSGAPGETGTGRLDFKAALANQMQAHATPAAPEPGSLPGAPAPSATRGGPAGSDITLATPTTSPLFSQALGAQVSLLAKDGVQTAVLQLNPAEMGPITVQIVMDGNAARVEFQAAQSDTRALIETSLPALAGALQDAGLTLAGGGVFEQPPGRQPPQAEPDTGSRQRGDRGHEQPDSRHSAGSSGPLAGLRNSAPRGLVDLLA